MQFRDYIRQLFCFLFPKMQHSTIERGFNSSIFFVCFTCLTVFAAEVTLAYTSARVHIVYPMAGAVFSTYKSDINFVWDATVAAFISIKALTLAVEAHPVTGAVRQKTVDCRVKEGTEKNRNKQVNQKVRKYSTGTCNKAHNTAKGVRRSKQKCSHYSCVFTVVARLFELHHIILRRAELLTTY